MPNRKVPGVKANILQTIQGPYRRLMHDIMPEIKKGREVYVTALLSQFVESVIEGEFSTPEMHRDILPDQSQPPYLPTPEEIRQRAAELKEQHYKFMREQ